MDSKEDQMNDEIDPLMNQEESRENLEMPQIAQKWLSSCSLLYAYVWL